jgi:hypothetical protein
MLGGGVSEVRLVEVEATAAEQALVVHLSPAVLVASEIRRKEVLS